jgi:hypothetical protein
LLDDIWALALANLPKLRQYESIVGDESPLTGRNLEPWWAVLSMAKWLEDEGVEGVYRRMCDLSVTYQTERAELESADLNALIIRALCKEVGFSVDEVRAGDVTRSFVLVKTHTLTDTFKSLAVELEADIEVEHITAKRVGRSLGRMRFQHVKEAGTGQRGWKIDLKELRAWVETLSITEIEDEVVQREGIITADDIPY